MVNFLVPLRARELGASYDVIGVIVAASALVPAFFSVPLGTIVARLGSRRAFVAGCAVCATASFAFMGVTGYWWLLPVQLVLGTGRMTAWIASQSYVTNIGPPAERSKRTGRFGFFSNLGPMVSTLMVGGAAQLLGFQVAFSVIAVYCAAFAVLGVAMIELGDRREAVPGKRSGVGFRAALPLLRVPGVQTALSLTFVRILVERTWQSFVPVLLVAGGIPPAAASTVVFVKSVVSTVVAPLAGRLTRLASPATVLIIGLGIGAVGLAITTAATSMPWAYGPAMMVGLGTGLSLPLLLTILADSTSESDRPVALSMRASVNGTASTAAPALTGMLIAAAGTAAAFGALAAIGAGFLFLAVFSARRMAGVDAPAG
jgi:MFS family permease